MTDSTQFLGLASGLPFDTQEIRGAMLAPYEFEMWLCGGQSNSAGAQLPTVAQMLPGGNFAPVPNLFMVEGEGTIVGARAGHHFGPIPGGNFSIGGVSAFWEFCRLRAQMYPERKILMCSAALGGTKLVNAQWDVPPATLGANIAKLRGMLSTVLNNSTIKVHVGGVWWQGHESDGFAGETKATYKARYLAMRTYLIDGLSDVSGPLDDRPWMLASFHDDWIANGVAPNILAPVDPGVPAANMRVIHEAITEMCREQTNFYYVPSNGLVLFDTIHWDAVSQRRLGRRLFRAVNRAQAELRGNLEFRGTWAPNGNTPPSFPANARKGDFYTATAQTLAGLPVDGLEVLAGDILLALVDNPRTDLYANQWLKIRTSNVEFTSKTLVSAGAFQVNLQNTALFGGLGTFAGYGILDVISPSHIWAHAFGRSLGAGLLFGASNYPTGTDAWTVFALRAGVFQMIMDLQASPAGDPTYRMLVHHTASGAAFTLFSADKDNIEATFNQAGWAAGLQVSRASDTFPTFLRGRAKVDIATDNTTNRTTVRTNPTNVEVHSGATGGDGTKIATVLSNGDMELHVVGRGIILASPDGTRYKATMVNGGTWAIAPA